MITYDKFAARVAEAMKRLGLPAEKEPPLDLLFADYRRASLFRRNEVIRGFVEKLKLEQHGLPPFAEARSRLFPRLRPRAHYDFVRLRGLAEQTARTTVAPDLCVEVVYEGPRASRVVVDDMQVERWGITFPECYWAALENLRRVGRMPWNRPAQGVHASGDASQLVLTDVILGLPVRGAPVAVAPHRDLLVVTGSEDNDGLGLVSQLVRAAVDQPRLLSIAPIAWDGERWVPFLPPGYHLRYEAMRKLHLSAASRDYREQKALLEPRYPLHAVPEMVIDDADDGRPESICTLREDALPALLPKTDRVALAARGGGPQPVQPIQAIQIVRWDRIAPLAKALGTTPERWEVTHFPAV